MTYEIVFSKKADNQLLKLRPDMQDRITSALDRIRVKPERHVRKLVGEPGYRLRVGDYRVILEIQNNKLIILVIKIAHRKNIYKRI